MNYHAHLYFSEETLVRAESLRSELLGRFGDAVRLFPLHDKAIGPHPVPSFGVAFTSPIVADMRAWLQSVAPEVSCLLHPITADDREAHSRYAEWYGTKQALRFDRLGERPNPTRAGLTLVHDPAPYPDHLDIDGYLITAQDSAEPVATVALGTYYLDMASQRSVLDTCGIYDFHVSDLAHAEDAFELCIDYLQRFTDAKSCRVHIHDELNQMLSLCEKAGFQRLTENEHGSTVILGLNFRDRETKPTEKK